MDQPGLWHRSMIYLPVPTPQVCSECPQLGPGTDTHRLSGETRSRSGRRGPARYSLFRGVSAPGTPQEEPRPAVWKDNQTSRGRITAVSSSAGSPQCPGTACLCAQTGRIEPRTNILKRAFPEQSKNCN